MSLRTAIEDIIAPRSAEPAGGIATSAGIAFVEGAATAPEAVWIPRRLAEEPAFLTYSITKTFTAALVLLLRDAGRVSLDDRLARWFPRIDGAERIAVRQLLNHTAGIPDYGGLAAYHEAVRRSPSAPWPFERFAAETFDRGLRFEPGAGWAYSNPGYMLVMRIVAEVAARPYPTLVADLIARPLGLDRTFVPQSVADLQSLAPAPSRALGPDGTPRDVRSDYHPGWVSHGVVASTPSDVARFVHALFGGRLVSSSALQEMTTLVPVPVDPAQGASAWVRPAYGLGVMGDEASRWGRVWGHNGGGPGYRTSALHAPDLGALSVCAMCASEEDSIAERLVFAALDAARGRGLRR